MFWAFSSLSDFVSGKVTEHELPPESKCQVAFVFRSKKFLLAFGSVWMSTAVSSG